MDKEQKPSGMFYQKLVEEVNDGIIVTQGGKVVFANTRAVQDPPIKGLLLNLFTPGLSISRQVNIYGGR